MNFSPDGAHQNHKVNSWFESSILSDKQKIWDDNTEKLMGLETATSIEVSNAVNRVDSNKEKEVRDKNEEIVDGAEIREEPNKVIDQVPEEFKEIEAVDAFQMQSIIEDEENDIKIHQKHDEYMSKVNSRRGHKKKNTRKENRRRTALKNKGIAYLKALNKNKVRQNKHLSKLKVAPTNKRSEVTDASEILKMGKDLGLDPIFSDNDTLNIIMKRLRSC